MSLSREQCQNPGELLFRHLQSKCDTSEKRNAAIAKIMASKGGIDTVKKAIEFCQPTIDKYHAEVSPLRKARETAKYDRMETINYGDREYPCEVNVGIGGPAGALDNQIQEVDKKYDPLISIYYKLTGAVSTAEYDAKKAEEATQLAAKEAEAERDLAYIQELSNKQFDQRPRFN